MEFHEDMAQHDKVVKAAKAVKEEDIWEDVLFKFSTEIMHRRESDIVKDFNQEIQD